MTTLAVIEQGLASVDWITVEQVIANAGRFDFAAIAQLQSWVSQGGDGSIITLTLPPAAPNNPRPDGYVRTGIRVDIAGNSLGLGVISPFLKGDVTQISFSEIYAKEGVDFSLLNSLFSIPIPETSAGNVLDVILTNVSPGLIETNQILAALKITLSSEETPAPTATALITSATDDAGPIQGPLMSGANTDDKILSLAGTLSEGLGQGQSVQILRDSSVIGLAIVDDISNLWSFETPELDDGTYTFTSRIINSEGVTGQVAEPSFTVTVNSTLPPEPPILPTFNELVSGLRSVDWSYVRDVVGPAFLDPSTELDIRQFIDSQDQSEIVLSLPPIVPGAIGSDGLTIGAILVRISGADLMAISTLPFLQGSVSSVSFSNALYKDARFDSEDPLFTLPLSSIPASSLLPAILNNLQGSSIATNEFLIALGVSPDIIRPPLSATASIESIVDDAGPVTGALADGGRTDDITLTVAGATSRTLTSGERVVIYNGDTPLGSVQPEPGSTSFTFSLPSLPSSAGTAYSLQVAVENSEGSTGPLSSRRSFILDTQEPIAQARIVSILDSFGPIKGPIERGAFTDDPTPIISGSLTAKLSLDESVLVLDGNELIGIAEAFPQSDTWSFQLASPADSIDGIATRSITAVVSDSAGNRSTVPEEPFTFGYQPTSEVNVSGFATGSKIGIFLSRDGYYYDLAADRDSGLDKSLFSVSLNGSNIGVKSARIFSATSSSPAYVLLDVAQPSLVNAGELIVSYSAPTSPTMEGTGILIEAISEDPIEGFDDKPITVYVSGVSTPAAGLGSAYGELYLQGPGRLNGHGNSLPNTIVGTNAANLLDGKTSADVMVGYGGDDTYVVDNAADVVVEVIRSADTFVDAGGVDTVRSSVSWTLGDHLENLVLIGSAAINGTGNSLRNTITGNDFDNVIDGGGNQDTMKGGKGSDTYIVDDLNDKITEVASKTDIDTVLSSVTWVLGANLENLTLTGSLEVNGTGNNLPNSIIGNGSNNILDGGKAGKDFLTGRGGADGFQFSTRPTKFSASEADVITDYDSAQGDKIRIKRSAFGINAKITSASFESVSDATALSAQLTSTTLFIYDSSTGFLHWNQNGVGAKAGSGGVIAFLENKAALSAADLVLY